MKIVIDMVPLLGPLTGVGNYTYNIAKSLRIIDMQNDYTYYYGFFTKRLLLYGRGFSKGGLLLKLRMMPLLRRLGRVLKERFPTITGKSFDLYFEPNFIPLEGIKAKHIVTTVHDLSFHRNPSWHPPERIQYFKKYFWKNILRSEIILADSEFTKMEILQFLDLLPERIRVIYSGYNKMLFRVYPPEELETFKKAETLPERFILFVGSVEPRKNLERLLQAYLMLDKDLKDEVKLLLIGFKGWENIRIMELLEKLKGNVLYRGYLSEEKLAKVYNLCTIFVYPSLYEGFGLPPLEAMACGCAVLVSNIDPLREVCQEGAYYVDPLNPEDISHGIGRLLRDKTSREDLARKGLRRAQDFDWQKTAREILCIFDEISQSA
jgi:glycosyltransferase involved in cell wall biosynthesis